jgi:hypothetical protein
MEPPALLVERLAAITFSHLVIPAMTCMSLMT